MPIASPPLPMALPRKPVPARSALNGADIGTPGSANTDGAHAVQAGGATVAPYVGNGAGMQSAGTVWLDPVAMLSQAWWLQNSRAQQVFAAAAAGSALHGADIGTPGSANTDGAHVVQAGGATVSPGAVSPYVGNGAGMQSAGRAWLGPVALLSQAWRVQNSRPPQVSAAAMARTTTPTCLNHLPQRRARIAPRVDHTSIRRRRA